MVETIKDDAVGLYADFDNRKLVESLTTKRKSPKELPVIDFTAYSANGTAEQRQSVAHRLRAACVDTGFFYLINHGISQAEFDVAHDWGQMLFELPNLLSTSRLRRY